MNLLGQTDLKWRRYTEDEDYGYPVDYAAALLSAREDGHIDVLYRWAPNCYCHFHRHAAATTSVVLEGELHVTDVDPDTGEALERRIRRPGDYAYTTPGDQHMECGGPDGALVLFTLYAPEGRLAETLAQDGTTMDVWELEPILARRRARA